MPLYLPSAAGIVKSVRQRWLFDYWKRLSAARALPAWSDLDADELSYCTDDLTILDVLPHNAGFRFRIFTHGKNIGKMYAAECAGKYLDDLLPAAVRDGILETYEHAVTSKLPVYTISQVCDAKDRPVYYERLLLPFGDAEGRVTRIVGFLEMISPDGAFDRDQLLADPKAANAYQVRAVLTAGAEVTR